MLCEIEYQINKQFSPSPSPSDQTIATITVNQQGIAGDMSLGSYISPTQYNSCLLHQLYALLGQRVSTTVEVQSGDLQ